MNKQRTSFIENVLVHNVVPVVFGLITLIVTFMSLSNRVDLLNQKMDLLLNNQEKLIASLSSDISTLQIENQAYALRLKTLEIQVGGK